MQEVDEETDKNIDRIIKAYFKEKGVPNLIVETYEEMMELIERISKDVPYIKECFSF